MVQDLAIYHIIYPKQSVFSIPTTEETAAEKNG
jgi:hypothetical protein